MQSPEARLSRFLMEYDDATSDVAASKSSTADTNLERRLVELSQSIHGFLNDLDGFDRFRGDEPSISADGTRPPQTR